MIEPYSIAQAARRIAAKDPRWLKMLQEPRVLDVVTNDAVLQSLPIEVAVAHWGIPKVIEAIGVGKILEALPPEKRLEHVSPAHLLRDMSPDRVLELLRPESVINHLKPFRVLEFLGPDLLLKLQDPEQWLEFFGSEKVIKYLTADRILTADAGKNLLNAAGIAAVVQHFGAEQLLRHIGPEMAVRAHGAETLLQRVNDRELFQRVQIKRFISFHGLPAILDELPPNDKSLPQAIVSNPKLLDAVLNDPRTIEHIVSSQVLRNKIRLFDARKIADRLPYALPAAVVSFPRSGSNFLQAQLQRLTSFANVSLYGPLPDQESAVLTVKSHAPTPEYLRDEYDRRLAGVSYPGRIVLLKRDPRDIMISFYEYTQHVRSISLSQEEFLDTDYFFASGIDKDLSRRVHPRSLSVAEAFKEFVKEWPGAPVSGTKVLEVRYEDLVADADNAFKQVFTFLEVPWETTQLDISKKVSLYDSSREQRGLVSTWQVYGDRYRTLIDDVTRRLMLEIRAWNYDADGAPALQKQSAQR